MTDPVLMRTGNFSRLAACLNAEDRVVQASLRLQDLTFGTRRPRFVPAEAGDQTWDACNGIERSEPSPRDR